MAASCVGKAQTRIVKRWNGGERISAARRWNGKEQYRSGIEKLCMAMESRRVAGT